MPDSSPEELCKQSVHVLWSYRQLLAMEAHLSLRQCQGQSVMSEPLDAAVLETFALHAQALIEFLWRDRNGEFKPNKHDAVATDWFGGEWRPEPELFNELYEEVSERTGWGVAHLSYKRQREPHPTWDHESITHRISSRFAAFAAEVDPDLVLEGFCGKVENASIEWRRSLSDSRPFSFSSPLPQSAATPADPDL